MREPSLIVNLTRGGAVCERAAVADRFFLRLRGLMGRRELEPGRGLLLRPAPAIHTAFVRFPIDAVFLDANLAVVSVVERLAPWRTARARQARAVLELPAGESSQRGLQVGDRLGLLEATPDALAWTGPDAEDPEGLDNVEPLAPRRNGKQSTTLPIRVLLVSADRRFRSVTALLLARRGVAVTVADNPRSLADLVARDEVEVVVIDAGQSLTAAARSAATTETMIPPVGIVMVGDQAEQRLPNLPVLAKWGSFEDFFAAVAEAHRDRGYRRPLVQRG
jgi:uncharacterized membrane protein (UPF0127 family)/CheY-like chemotaxis protein